MLSCAFVLFVSFPGESSCSVVVSRDFWPSEERLLSCVLPSVWLGPAFPSWVLLSDRFLPEPLLSVSCEELLLFAELSEEPFFSELFPPESFAASVFRLSDSPLPFRLRLPFLSFLSVSEVLSPLLRLFVSPLSSVLCFFLFFR